MAAETKHIANSKTAWVAVAAIALGVLEGLDVTQWPDDMKRWAVPVLGALMLWLRFVTKGGVKIG